MSTPVKPPEGPKGGTPSADAAEATEPARETFTDAVDRVGQAGSSPIAEVQSLTEALRSGSINKETFVEKLLESSEGLARRLGLDDVEGLRAFLTNALEDDPTLRALVEDLERGG